jgi:dihydrofolate reductase
MRLVLMQFISLDGITQGPGSPDEDTTGGFSRGGWFVPYLEDEFVVIVQRWSETADAYLFGRRTYTAFGEAWPNMPDLDDPVARSLNSRPKFVVSTTLTDADATWGPATVVSRDVPAAVAQIKGQAGGEVQIHGSTTLARSMLREGLVDELRLVVAPVIVGSGRRLFDDDQPATALRLRNVQSTPGGLVIQTFDVDGPATFGTYEPAAR